MQSAYESALVLQAMYAPLKITKPEGHDRLRGEIEKTMAAAIGYHRRDYSARPPVFDPLRGLIEQRYRGPQKSEKEQEHARANVVKDSLDYLMNYSIN